MPDVEMRARYIWNKRELLHRARQAAAVMDLSISQARDDGFRAGSQWWGAYEIEVWISTKFFSHIVIHGRTLKVGFNSRLYDKCALLLDLVRNPTPKVMNEPAVEVEVVYRSTGTSWERMREREEARLQLRDFREMREESDSQTVVYGGGSSGPSRARQGLASLRKRSAAMGIDLMDGSWDPLTQLVMEAFNGEVPTGLPVYVQTPADVERWYSHLHKYLPDGSPIEQSLEKAMNQNRQINAAYFGAH
ncbi:hypothetical protein [Gordonia sp. ABSL49_1]|uniref:hypothetical protein n=1 Tax=Gordonia sp. ABSL49_1 TaxID=2920941 RepID=UPI001F0E4FF3|nr:hypothetical protein [Gordonia sp. ABSL49_1]MCH5644679.1 hypothetical protein [Gordonia sp. ABSL49_1]